MTNEIVAWLLGAALVTLIWMGLLFLVVRAAVLSALRDGGLTRVKPKPVNEADSW